VEESLLALDAVQFAMRPDGRVVIPGPDGTVLELDIETGATKTLFTVVAGEDWHQSASAAQTDGALLIRETNQQVYVIDATSGDAIHVEEVAPELQIHIACSADGSACAWNFVNSRTVLLDRHSGEAVVWSETSGLPLAISPDGRRVVLLTGLRTVEARDVATRKLEYVIELNEQPPNGGVRFSPDGSRLAISGGRSVWMFDATTGERADVHVATGHTDAIQALAFSPDGSLLASGSRDRTIRLVDVRTGYMIQLLAGHRGTVLHLAFSLDGRRLISRDDLDRLRVWDIGARREPDVLRGHASYVYPVAFSPDGARIYSGGWDGWKERPGCIRVWDAKTGEPVAAWGAKTQITESLAVSTDGSRIFTCSRHSSDNFEAYGMQVWDALTGRELPAPEGKIRIVAVSPDRRFVGAAEASVLRLLDAESLAPIAELEHPAQLDALAFSPDGSRVATVTLEGRLRVWSTESREVLVDVQEIHGEAPGCSVTYSGDSRRIYLTSWSDHDIRIRDAETGDLIAALEGHGASVFHVLAETAAGRTFSGGRDGRILVWDVEAHEQVTALSGHDSYVYALALSPNGRTLVSSSGDGTLRLWDTEPVRHRQQAIANRQRSVAELYPRVLEMFDVSATEDDVFATLRMDASMPERQREIALQIALEVAVKRRQQ
jgi:WD40 repeat protein